MSIMGIGLQSGVGWIFCGAVNVMFDKLVDEAGTLLITARRQCNLINQPARDAAPSMDIKAQCIKQQQQIW